MQLQKTQAPINRQSRIGQIYFHNGKMMYFLGYATCDTCDAKNRILVPRDNLEKFNRQFGAVRPPIGARLTHKLMRHYGL